MKVNPLVDGVNKLILTTHARGLYFYGVDYNMGPLWMLDGMTPVGVRSALDVLKTCGAKTGRLERLFAEQEAEKERGYRRKERLRESARKKLTPAEIAACDL